MKIKLLSTVAGLALLAYAPLTYADDSDVTLACASTAPTTVCSGNTTTGIVCSNNGPPWSDTYIIHLSENSVTDKKTGNTIENGTTDGTYTDHVHITASYVNVWRSGEFGEVLPGAYYFDRSDSTLHIYDGERETQPEPPVPCHRVANNLNGF